MAVTDLSAHRTKEKTLANQAAHIQTWKEFAMKNFVRLSILSMLLVVPGVMTSNVSAAETIDGTYRIRCQDGRTRTCEGSYNHCVLVCGHYCGGVCE
jgi:hypothetical protein